MADRITLGLLLLILWPATGVAAYGFGWWWRGRVDRQLDHTRNPRPEAPKYP